jgi:uncharacterized protein (DUF305 family)
VKLGIVRPIAIATGFILSAAALTGCTINIGNSGNPNNHGMMGGNQNASGYSGMDIMFAQMMIPHHQQAIEMGALAETRAQDPAVRALAVEISMEQGPEIEQMKQWLKKANAPMDMGHDMGMGGMLSESQMEDLANASGAEFDRLFLEGMILHHRGAIQMAQMVQDSANSEVKALALAIIDSQTKQIAYMEQLLTK